MDRSVASSSGPRQGSRVCRAAGPLALVALASAGACLPGAGPPINPYVDDAGPPPPASLGDDAAVADDVDLGGAFAVTGLQPSHGPWTGGTRTTISGHGFASNVEVWVGGAQLTASDVFASDPTRITIVTPPGAPGPADVRVRDVASAQDATLAAGFFYDSLQVVPSSGATTGGTRIALQGKGTHWTSASTVAVGGKPCTALAFTDATDLACSTPPNDPGSQDVTVTNADGTIDRASDAFVYGDSPDGYRGGLYGGALAGKLTVLAFDDWTGTPLSGEAIAGSSLAKAVTGRFDSNGVVQLTSPSLMGKVTVTVVAPCHQPWTYVDVPVDTVTVYLNPVLDPSCAGDPPSSGNYSPADDGEIDGELVWSGGIEFQRAPWNNVPMPSSKTQRQAAYAWTAAGNPRAGFGLPSPSSATTPQSSGTLGYGFSLVAQPGNVTVYALAGIEDDATSPPTFEAYAMGAARGVGVQPGAKTLGVDIPMTTLLDRALTVDAQTPAPTPRGPDRLQTTVAVDLGAWTYAILPQGSRTSLLPVAGGVSFVGVPALDGTLATARYDVAAAAVTGANAQTPVSVVSGVETTDANDPLTLGGFLPIPTLAEPSAAAWSGTHVTLQASGPVDLAVIDAASGGGYVTWTIVAPGSDLSFDLPDISQVPGIESLVHGTLVTTFSVARIDGFQYGRVRNGQLYGGSWNAYAQDQAQGSY